MALSTWINLVSTVKIEQPNKMEFEGSLTTEKGLIEGYVASYSEVQRLSTPLTHENCN